MHISAFHKEWPEAKCIGPEGVAEKKPDVKWTGIFGKGGETLTYGFEEEVSVWLSFLRLCVVSRCHITCLPPADL